MTPEQLKASILQLAIQGKLVPQRQEEGTAEELYQQIQREKKKLTAAGKLKKEKPLPPISDDEIPFDIPQSWKWVRLGELSKIVTGKRDANFGSIDGEYLFFTCAKDPIRCATYSFDCNAILMAGNGDLSNISRYCGKFEAYQRTYVVEGIGSVNLDYIYYHLSSNWVAYNKEKIYGSVIQYVRLGNLLEYAVALPPLAEQQRIVEKIEQMLPLVERYGEAYTALESLDSRFPDDMRKSILQYAIQGKLVPQLPEEGTAEDLYQQIQKEKKKLIAAGKLKKEKPLPPITEEEIPFDIPQSWKWVRLGELGVFERGAGIKKSEVVKEGLPCVRYGQLYTTYKESFKEAVSFVPKELFAKCKQAHKGDILMALTGENKPDIALAVVYEGENPIAIGGDMTRFTPILVNSHYLMKVINSPHGIAQKVKTATGDIIVHTSNDKLATILIPLPPLAEQRHIVQAIESVIANI